MRTYCHWLALLTGMAIAGGVLLLTWLAPEPQPVTAQEETACQATDGTYCGTTCCSSCHPQQRLGWSSTPHAVAGVTAGFQVGLMETDDPNQCYECHTTGYEPASGRYAQAGVTCERCHGPYQPDHNAEQMAVADTPVLCSTCHADRLAEWQSGAHGEPDLVCIDCHPTHPH